jgi:anti-repressor protein
MFAKLREDGYLMSNNQPYQEFVERGLFVVIENTPFTDRDGRTHPTFTTRITGKGQVALEKRYRKPRTPILTVVESEASS